MIRGMGMKIGSCAMTGFTSSTPQRLSSVVMAMFALYQTAGRYTNQFLRRVVNLVPATVCPALALVSALVFSSAPGALAQDTTAPVGVFELPASHDGITPFTAVIVFDEEPKRIWPLELVGLLIRGSTDPETQTQPVQIYTNTDHAPLITNRRKDANDKRRYLFDVTPRAPVDIRFRLSGGYTDVAGNVGPTISSPAIPYVAPAGGNNQPEANAGPDQVVDPGDTVTLDGSESSDRDGNETITYSWARTGGTTGVTAPTLTGSTTDSPTFTADTLTSGDDDVVHVFTLTVTDDHDETDTDTMTVTVEAPDTNPVPIASAGVDQEVISGALVTLDGSASGDDGWIASWAWERTGGTEGLDGTVSLNNPNAIKPTFTANTLAVGGGDVIHIFTLVVTDNEGATGIDTVAVIIKAPLFAAPVANAGPDQTFDIGATVTLDGSGSTFDSRRTPLDYAWKRTGGTADPVTLAGADTAMPTFTAVAPVLLPSMPFATHIFELTVTDSAGEISTDTVTVWIVIPTARSAPVADAGMDRTVTSRAEVRLDGSGSTVHSSRTIRSYAWRWVKQLSTPNVEAITLTNPNTSMASFTAPVLDVGAKDITHVFELTVTDSAGQINKDTVSITVIFPFANPVANAGQDRKVGSGTVVTLDGSDSTVDLRRPDASKSYAWARTGGTGDNTVTLTSETTARPSFMAETLASNATDVTHIFTLTVTDSAGVQHTDTVTITVTLGNADPVANAGDDQPAVVSGTTVTLDGSDSSDSDGSISKFAWARTGGTGDASITLSSDSVAEPTFRAEILQTGAADVTHIFTLTVTDDDQATATDTVTITVTPANAVPIANAGQDRTVDPATMVQLDGSDSLDIDGRIVSWAWARTGGTAGGSATLTDAMTARPTFTSDALQMDDDDVIHIFTLTVTDDDGGINTATVTITVSFGDTVPPIGRFEAEDGGPVPHSYGSLTAFKLALVFNEEVTFDASDVTTVISDETPVKDGIPFKDRIPTVMGFEQDKTDARRYVFIVTPEDTAIPSFRIVLRARNYQDSAGNRGVADIVTAPILYVDPTVTNIAPVADAGDDRTVNSGMRNVRLDGTGSSDTEGEIRTWAWARTGGTAGGSVTLSDESAAQPTFTADTLTPGGADVTHEFTLTVTDMSRHAIHEQTRQRNPETGVTTIISDTRNPVPSACRDGRASDEHCTLAYRNSAEDTVTVTVDAPPLADAGDDQTADSAALVTLDGSGSRDSNTTNLTYAWERTGGTTGGTATLTGANTNMPTFTSDTVDPGAADVTHTFTLTVTDSRLQSHTDTVTVTVSNPNADPVANAGPDREVLAGTVVTLNGSGSSDSDGDDTITTYSWARTDGTEGVAAPTLAATAQPTFTADTLTPGDADVIHIFTLTVTDNAGAMDTDMVTITVVAEDTTRPEGTFVSSASHDGATSFTVELVFNEEVEFSKGDLQMLLVGVPAQNLGSNPRFHYDLDTHEPTRSGFAQDPNNELRYTFSVTPKVPLSLRIALRGRNYEDLSGNTGTNISITIPFSGPSNKRPVAEAGDDLTVASGTEVTLDGSESMDEDGTVQYYAWVRTGGTGDPLALTGADTDMPTFTPRLSGGTDDVTHIFTLWVSDNDLAISKADTVTVTVTAPTAPNVVPVADAGDDRTVQSGVPATLDGGESSDDDGTIKSWAWTRTGGTGNASLALTGADREQSTFTADTLAPGAEDVTHIFSLVVLDDVNVPSVADTVTITVNAPPLANAGSDQTADSAALVTLDGSGSKDSNTTNLTYAWERTGGTTGGTVTLTGANTNMPTFTADTLAAGAADVIHTFTLTVTDDEGAINTDTVTITVDGPNKPPVPNAGLDQTVASGETVTIDGRGSTDSDGFVMGYEWSASGSDLFNNPELKATDTAGIETFTAPVLSSGEGKRTIRYALIVTDNEGLDSGDADEVTITVVPSSSNVRPVANAGTDQRVASGATVTLEGSGTDNGTIQDYYWVRASTGFAPTLSANNVARPTFTAPILVEGSPDVTYTYALRVKDNEGAVSDADEVTITVEIPRVADAGMDQTVAAGAPVTLDGSGSSGTIAEYQWSRVSGTSARADVFPGASGTLTREVSRITPTITFVADNVPSNSAAVTHVFALRVFGANRVSSPKDEITVTVNPNRLPIANAGPDQSVAAGANVDLDGRGSIDNDGTIASYNWTRTGGDATATLTGANTATPSFTAEMLKRGAADTTHTFTLTVTDNNGETDTDTVTVTVIAPNAPPKAVAYVGRGDSGVNTATVDSDSLVFLNASGSDDTDGDIVSYLWERSGGTEGRSVELNNAKEELASFTTATLPAGADDVIHIFKLTVTDNDGAKNADETTVTITVASPFKEPVANAGDDQTVASEATVELDGSGSTKDRRVSLDYSWQRTGGTMGSSVTLSSMTAVKPTFTADSLTSGAEDVIHIFTLTVEDDEGESDEDMVTVTVEAPDVPNAGPIANAGPDQLEVVSGTTVQLDGSGSSVDPRRTATYSWVRTGGTTGGMVTFSPSATVESPTFPTDTLTESDSDVTHIFTLTVTDSEGEMATDMVTIIVKAPVPDTTKPTGTITALGLAQNNHDGMTPINFQVVFDEPVLGFTAEDIDRNPWNVPDDEDKATHTATISKFMKDPTNPLRYTFTLTPGVDSSGSGSRLAFTVSIPQEKITDAIGNKNLTIRGPHLTYSAPSTNIRPVADAGVDQTKRHGELVTLDGSGSMDPDGLSGEMLKYSWARTGVTTGVTVNLSDTKAEMPTFTANAPPGTVNVVHIFTLTVTDEGGLTGTDTVMVVILSPFLTLTANAGVDQEVISGATVTLDGSASIVDGRTSIAQYSWARTGGTTGATATLSNTKVAKPTFTADTLAEGAANVEHIFTLTVTDNEDNTSDDTVMITVTAPLPAPNVLPIAVAGPDVTIKSGESHRLDAGMSYDPDHPQRLIARWQWFRLSSGGVPLRFHNSPRNAHVGSPAKTLLSGAADDVSTYYLIVIDHDGAECEKTIAGGNQGDLYCDSVTVTTTAPPLVDESPDADAGMDQEVDSGETVDLDGSGSMPQEGRTIMSYAWTWAAGTEGATEPELSDATAIKPTFTADRLEAGAENVEHIYTLTVTDSVGDTDMDTVTITVTSPIKPLVADAGEPQTADSGVEVTLDGRGSTHDRRAMISYSWARTGGTGIRVDLTDAETARPKFTDSLAPGAPDATHIFTLTVSDDQGSTPATDMVTITIEAPEDFPPLEASAGADQTVDPGDLVTLKGSGTRLDLTRGVTYAWTWAAGTVAATEPSLSDPAVLRPTFTAAALAAGAADVIHIYTLTITDNMGSTPATASVRITVTAPFAETVADAGPDRTYASGATVPLNGSGSTSDRRFPIGEWKWERTDGTEGATVTALTNADMEMASFTANILMVGDEDVIHIFTLTVTDSDGDKDTDTVRITIEATDTTAPPPNAKPVATVVTTTREFASGTMVELVGSGTDSDSDDETLTYAWTRTTRGTSTNALVLTGETTKTLGFTADNLEAGAADVTHVFELVVTDTDGAESDPVAVTITITSPFAAPVAKAVTDESEYASGATVTLASTGSLVDRRRGPIAFTWARTGGTGGAVTLSSMTAANPTFTADMLVAEAEPVTHTFTLTVTDSTGATATDTVEVTITSPFADPVARAVVTGGQTTVTAGDTVMLDGSGSTTDRRRTIMTYTWTGETAEVTASLTDADMDVATFRAETLTAGAPDVTHTFTLTVTDSAGETATAMVTITVTSNALPVATVVTTTREFASGTMVELVGSGTDSDSDDETLTYAWTRTTRGTSTNALVLTGETTKTLGFTADNLEAGAADVTHVFELVVTDTDGAESDPVAVTITITSPFAAPVADAGLDQEVNSGRAVLLNGTGSETDRRRTLEAFNWRRVRGTGGSVTLDDASLESPRFTADTLVAGAQDVTHVFELIITDSENVMSAADEVEITVNAPPLADAGEPATVNAGGTISLDGTGSMDTTGTLIHSWIRADGSTADLTDANTDTPEFTAEALNPGAADVEHVFTLTVTDANGATNAATVTITVNAPPLVNAGEPATVNAGGTISLDGTGSTDTTGTLIHSWIRADGSTADLTDANTATPEFTAEALNPGAADVEHVFTLTVTDAGATDGAVLTAIDTVTITVNAPPLANAGAEATVNAGGMISLDGTGSTDTTGTYTRSWVRADGTTTGLTGANTDTPEFTAEALNPGAADVMHVFTLTVTDAGATDGAVLTAIDTVTITVNAPPLADAGEPATVNAGETISLDGAGSTDTTGTLIHSWIRADGTTTGLTGADTGTPEFTAEALNPGAADVMHVFTLVVTDAGATDGAVLTATDTVTITVNAPPLANAGAEATVNAGEMISLDGTGSSDTTGTLAHSWVRADGTTTGLTGADTSTPEFTAETLDPGAADVEHVFTLTVTDAGATDGAVLTATDTVTITVNAPPLANAGTGATVNSGGTIALNGTGSSDTTGMYTHAWTPSSGTGGTLTDADQETASFMAPVLAPGAADVMHVFTLTVTDANDAITTDTVTIIVNAPPRADAGEPATVAAGETILLDGGDSTDTTGTYTHAWTRPAGATGTLAMANTATPSFTAAALAPGAADVIHVFTLTITDAGATDGVRLTATATVEITVISGFALPVANAGVDQPDIASGETVTLDGSGSTKDRRKTLNHAWARTGGTGSAATLNSTTAEQPTFTAQTLAPGAPDVTYIFTLTVTDGVASDNDSVTIMVISPFATPVANAVTARPVVDAGATVTLESTGSMVDRRRGPISFAWTRTGGTGANVTLTGANMAQASFTADMLANDAEDVNHTFSLTVMDSTGATAIDTVEVTVTANAIPVATLAGSPTRTVASGTPVEITGSGTDRDSDDTTLAYEWERTGGTGNSAVDLTGENTATLRFTADTLPEGAAAVTHIFEFVVTDNEGAESDPVAVTVTVDAPNAPPVAHAGPPPPPVASGGQVQLDGRESMVPGGTIVAWAWSRSGGTPGVTVTLTGADTPQPTVMANDLEPGGPDEIHEFTLIVTDDEGMKSVGATVMVTISAPIANPVANAGPDQRAVSKATVRLDGSGSTPDRRKTIASYAWERTDGTSTEPVTLTGANTAQPTFTADTLTPGVEAVTHVFTLTVTDEDGTTSTDTVTITVVSVDIRLSQSELMVQEGGSGTYQIRLSEAPHQDLTILAVSGNEDVVQLKNAQMVFNAENWNEWQAVEINTVASSNTDDPVVIQHRLVTAGATSPVPGDVTVTLRPRADDPIPRPVGQFLQTRATALINNQPGLSSLLELDGPTPGGSFTFQATDGQLALNGGFVHNSVWGKVSGAYASSESAAGNTKSVTKSVLASFGVHRKYSEHFLAGVMLQLDLSDHDRAGQVGTTDTIDGTGWLAGPYFAARHGSQPLYFEGRLLYGQSDNDIRFMDTGLGVMRAGSFDTRRLLAQIRVEGEIAMSGRDHGDDGGVEGPRLRPYADLRWIEDRAEAFTDNVNNRVPGQKVSTGQLELGSNVEIPIAVRTGEMTFTGGLGLVYSSTEGDYIPSDSRGRGRGEIGFSYDLDDTLRIGFESFYDGIGTSRYEGYGLSLSAEMKF